MEKYRAIPKGYMTVGELAKKMKTTVRTLQYYDEEGVLSPSGTSDGGRRLYTDKDMIMLHQIQSMKYLGFSLNDIKTRLVSLETPEEVVAVLTVQANAVREKIASLSEVLETIEKLKEETLQMQTVNFRKYADIVALLQAGDDYWMVKNFSDKMWEHIQNRFDDKSAKTFYNKHKRLLIDAAKLAKADVPPDGGQGIAIGKRWFDLLSEFTGSDISLLSDMQEFAEKRNSWDKQWREKWERAEGFLTLALDAYLSTLDHNPFEGAIGTL